METYQLDDVVIEVVQGDIASQGEVEAVVNAANAQLRTGGGVAGAIHQTAGPGLEQETRQHAPIDPGEVVITGAHDLPNDHVVHCLGPRWGLDTPEAGILANCYRRALDLADEHGVRSIAFPAISTGAFGYPMGAATDVALDTVLSALDQLESVERIRFVLFSKGDRELYERKLDARLSRDGDEPG